MNTRERLAAIAITLVTGSCVVLAASAFVSVLTEEPKAQEAPDTANKFLRMTPAPGEMPLIQKGVTSEAEVPMGSTGRTPSPTPEATPADDNEHTLFIFRGSMTFETGLSLEECTRTSITLNHWIVAGDDVNQVHALCF